MFGHSECGCRKSLFTVASVLIITMQCLERRYLRYVFVQYHGNNWNQGCHRILHLVMLLLSFTREDLLAYFGTSSNIQYA
mmetsp:Transcript_10826/g.25229  ORF Transcript_10826/g.25229 Transcript_10826/m.25229 type:complete len:80 (+) Transcript_10826:768-1007(+)